jgi:alpha-glucuronidase
MLPALVKAENGYDLWLRYKKISNNSLIDQYKRQINSPVVLGSSQTIIIIKTELAQAFSGLIGIPYKILSSLDKTSSFIAGTVSSSTIISSIITKEELDSIGNEGFIIKTRPGKTIITANTDIGVMYGVFHFLRLLQTQQSVLNLNIISFPKIKLRVLNHWDNLNRTVERGYAGFSIWDWHKLPDFIDKRYIDYARANASIGINSTVLTNVNANAVVLTKPYLEKVKALADLFRPYGIKVYLTARFSAPIEIGKLKTADPLNDTVQLWWKQKIKEIYELIPDFGGFLVKANSEGQPGPQDYNRTHAMALTCSLMQLLHSMAL